MIKQDNEPRKMTFKRGGGATGKKASADGLEVKGKILSYKNTKELNLAENPLEGSVAYVVSTKAHYRFEGGKWVKQPR